MQNKDLHPPKTKLAIVCPVFNEQGNIERTVESLLKQTSREFFCFFVDSGSEDDTASFVEKLPRDRFATLRFEDNLGISQNWGRALRNSLELAEFSHVMFLGGDDALSLNFVQGANDILADSSFSETTIIPKFVRVDSLGKESRIIDKNLDLNRPNLMTNWSMAHGCYSLVSRRFAETKYLPILENGAPNFDWWATFEVFGRNFHFSEDLEYYKFEKGMDYESDYYFGQVTRKYRYLSKLPPLLAPFAEALALFEAGKFSIDSMTKTERLLFKLDLVLARYREAIRRFLGR